MKRYRLPALLLCGMLMTGCAAQPIQQGSGSAVSTEPENVILSQLPENEFPTLGGSSLLKLPGNLAAAAALGENYQTACKQTTFTYTSDEAWEALFNGELDLIFAYAPSKEQQQALTEGGYLQQEVGVDALVFFAGEAPTGIALTREQILSAYTNPEAEWQGYSAAPHTTSSQLFAQIFGESAVGTQISYNDNTLTAACPHTAQTLCYTTWLSLLAGEKPVGSAIVAVDGIVPNAQTISETSTTVKYPLCIPYYVACRGDLEENSPTMLLYRWITSEQGMEWLSANGSGYIGLMEQ